MSQNEAQKLGLQRPQRHQFAAIAFNGAGSYNVNINCSFPVKEVRIRTAYTFTAAAATSFVIDMPTMLPEGPTVATMLQANLDVIDVGGVPTYAYYYSNNLSDESGIRYIFNYPRIINGSYDVVVKNLLAGAPALSNVSLLLHFELLG